MAIGAANRGINPSASSSQNLMSPFERSVYQDDPVTMNALNSYSSYRGASMPSANIAAPNVPGKISMNTRAAYVDPNQYNKIDTEKYYVDPESQKYQVSDASMRRAASGVTDFRMDTNDPVYRWKQQEARKSALKSLAGMGLTGSKYGIGTMADASMRVAADEADKQYERAVTGYGVEKDLYGADYQRTADLYGRTADQQNLLYQRDYTKESDLYNRLAQQKADQYARDYSLKSDNWNRSYQGAMARYQAASDNYNRAFQNASYQDNLRMNQMLNTYNMANQLDNQRYGRLLDTVQIGAGAAGAAGSYAMNSGSAIAGYHNQAGSNIAQNQIAAGQAEGQFWSGAGSLPMNALSMYYANQ